MNDSDRKAALIAVLRAGGAEAVATFRALPEGHFATGRYENGWAARDILAHLAAIEWTYARLLDLPSRDADADAGGRVERNVAPEVGSRMDDYNRKQVERRASKNIAELVAEFETNRAATIAAVEAAEPAALARQVESFGGMRGTLADVIEAVVVQHVGGHVRDIAG